MSTSPPPADDPAEPPARRRLLRRRPAPDVPEATTPAPPPGGPPAAEAPLATAPEEPGDEGPRRLRRRRRELLELREDAVYDLGGLAFELYRRDMLTEDVMRRRAGEVAGLDDTVRDIDARLSELERVRRERRTQAAEDPDVGCCLRCRATFRPEARFCWQCGAQLVPTAEGDEQPTVVIGSP
jgi:hypothetical protein